MLADPVGWEKCTPACDLQRPIEKPLSDAVGCEFFQRSNRAEPVTSIDMKTTEICVVRHGETAWNVAGRIQGHLDSPLTAEGREQVRALIPALRGEAFSACYSSDLGRTVHSAEIIARGVGLDVIRFPGLRERHYGPFQGLTKAEAEADHPDMFRDFRHRQPDFSLGGGESVRHFTRRVLDALNTLVRRHAGERLLVVTHGGVLDVIYRVVNELPLDTPRCCPIPNSGANWLAHDRDGWRLDRWADLSHLDRPVARDEVV